MEHTLREEERDSGLPARTEDHVTHAGNRGEHAIVTPTRVCYVDGFDPVTQTVYEFHGCVWHGCPRCHPNRRLVPKVHLDRSMEEVYDATCAKTSLLRSMGFTVVEMWECFWDDLSKHDPRLIQFLHTLEIVEPPDPRHAFYGGRTGATCLYHKTDEAQGEKVHYIDVTSEYPWVNKYRTYPVGRPQILTSPQIADLSDYYGIAKVDIVPPEELFNPVLPYRSGGKLTFPLCRTCVEQQQVKPMLDRQWTCTHTDQERLIRGTWCTPEISKAVQKGYRIVKIYEIWHFPEDQRVEGLFTGYVDTWLKMKQESSGRPSHVRTPEELQNYINHYEAHEGIQMEPGKIVKNAAKRSLAKLMLNSF